jgi:hypothetical protein
VGVSAEYTVANNFYKVDNFIHEKLLLPPPAPNLSGVERLGVITNLD